MYHPIFGHVRLLSRASVGGLGALGDDCVAILNEVYRLQKLAKTRSKKEHRQAAARLATQAQQRYQQCIASKAAATPVVPAPVTPTPVTPTPVTPAPIPYMPYYGGGGGGGGAYYPDALPIISPGHCVNEQGVQVPCESLTTQTMATVLATGQTAPNGQPVYYNQSTGQSFYYDPSSGQPVYYNAQTGRWMVPAALTPVPYAQMPTGAEYGGAEMPAGQMPTTLPQAEQPQVSAVQYMEMPYGGVETASVGTIKEEDFVGQGYAQYSDQWGPIKVIRLVIPKKATAQAVSGGQALPGGTMDIEQFTSEYALSGGWW